MSVDMETMTMTAVASALAVRLLRPRPLQCVSPSAKNFSTTFLLA